MGILIPTQTLTGPQSPLMGAATGLFEGLSRGIPIAEQMQQRRQESERQNTELAIQAGQVHRKNQREDASKRAAALLAQAAMMNEAGGGQGQGPAAQQQALPSVGQAEEQGPGTGGPPLRGPPEGAQQQAQSFGSPGTDWLHGQLANPNNGFSMEDTENILAAHQHDLHLNAITQHGARIAQTIQTGLDKGTYDAVDKDGHPDPTARIEMEKNLRKIQSLDRSDPRAAAAQLDEIENAESAARQYKAQGEKVFTGRQRRIQAAQNEIAQIGSQGPISPADHERADQMQSVVSDFQNGNIDDKEFGAKFEDARHGNLLIKQQLQQSQMEAAQAKADRDRAIAELNLHKATQGPPAPTYAQTKEGMQEKSRLDQNRQIAVEQSKRAQEFAQPHPRNPSEPLDATQAIEDKLKEDFPDHYNTGGFLKSLGLGHNETPEEEKKYEDERAALFKNAKIDDPSPPGGRSAAKDGKASGDSASAILNDKSASREEKIRRAQALGFKSYAEVEAAAKGGK